MSLFRNRSKTEFCKEDAEEHFGKLIDDYSSMESTLFPNGMMFSVSDLPPSFDKNHWEKVIADNWERSRTEGSVEPHYVPAKDGFPNAKAEIDDLFARLETS